MYGLFFYEYDYYEFEQLVVVSESKEKLINYDRSDSYPIANGDDEHRKFYIENLSHYAISEIKLI